MLPTSDNIEESFPNEIGEYRLLDVLGKGASAVVYRGCLLKDPATKVALKISKAHWSHADVETRVRFEQEAELLARLTHPNIVRFFTLDVTGNRLCLATELAVGETLSERLRRGPAMEVETVAAILEQTARGLAHAHSRGILHRDIKPSNIVVDFSKRDLVVKILDFGLGAMKDERSSSRTAGTFLYMSPELLGILPQRADERSDLYSLGIVAVELLSGHHPYAGQELRELIHSHAAVPPSLPDEVPPGLTAIVQAMVQKDPARRYTNATLLEKDLCRFRNNLRSGDGKAFPVQLHQPGLSLTAPGFTGRQDSLATLARLYESAQAGSLAVGIVSANSGYGKTRLLSEASRGWTRGIVLWGKGRAYGQTTAYGLMTEVLKSLADLPLTADQTARIKNAVGQRGCEITRLVPELAPLTGAPEESVPLEPEQRQKRFFDVVVDLLSALGTREEPLVIGLDDVQWADEGSLALFSALAARKGGSTLLLASYRPEETPEGSIAHGFLRGLAETGSAESIPLGPLTDADIERLVDSMLGERHPEVSAPIISQSAGCPLFAIELLHAMVENGAVVGTATGWTVPDVHKLDDVPHGSGLVQTIVNRLERLSTVNRDVLRLASVLGGSFTFQGLSRALSITAAISDEESARRVFGALRTAETLRLIVPRVAMDRFVFAHDKIREALYDRLDPESRRLYHRGVARSLESETVPDAERVYSLAHHYSRCEEPAKAALYQREAGEQALARHAHRDALDYFENARWWLDKMGLPADAPDRTRLFEGTGDALCMTGDYTRAVENYELSLQNVADDDGRVRLNTKLGRALLARSEATRATVVLEKALRLLGERVPRNAPVLGAKLAKELVVYVWHLLFPYAPAPPSVDPRLRLVCRLYNELSRTYFLQAKLAKSLWLHLRHFNIAEAHNVVEERAQAYSNHSPVCAEIGWFSRGVRYARKSLALRMENGDRWGAAQSRNCLILALFPLGRWEEIIEVGKVAEAEFSQLGDQWELAILLVLMSVIYSFMGDWDHAAAYCSRAYRIAQETKQPAAMAYALRTKAELGDRFPPQEILNAVEELLPQCRHVGQPLAVYQLLCSKGLVLKRCGRNREAEHAFREAIDCRDQHGLRFEATVTGYRDCAETLLNQAEVCASAEERRHCLREARALLTRSSRVSKAYVNQWPRDLNAWARWFWMKGRHRAAEKYWTEAHSLYVKKGSFWGQGMILSDWGSALFEVDPERARPLLKTAWLLMARLGSKSEMERLRKYLPEAISPDRSLSVSASISLPVSRSGHGEWVTAERLSTLVEVSTNLSTTLNLERLLEEVAATSARIFGAERAFLYLIDASNGSLVRKAAFMPENERARERFHSRTLIGDVLKTGKGIVVADAQTDARLSSTDSVTVEGILSLMCVPLKIKDRSLGVLYLDNRLVKGIFSPSDLKVLGAFASQTAVALENARLFSSQELARKEVTQLYETSKEFIGVMDRRKIFTALLGRARSTTGAVSGAVVLLHEGRPEIQWQQNFSPAALKDILAQVVTGGTAAPEGFPLTDGSRVLSAPITIQGKTEGFLILGGMEDEDHCRELLTHIVTQASLALTNSRLYELAITDELTALYQRRYYEMALKDLMDRKEPFALILIDLNEFKLINDTRGHAIGDEVLKRVGRELRRQLRALDVPTRIGGDEFAVLLPGQIDASVSVVVEKLRAAIAGIVIEEPGKSPPKVWASFGYALSGEGPIESIKVLADQRLYDDKEKSKTGRKTKKAANSAPEP